MSVTTSLRLYAVTPDTLLALPIPPQAVSVHTLFDNLPLGVYSALCTFAHHKFLDLPAHLARLEKGIAALGWDYQLDRWRLCQALDEVCRAYPYPAARVRFDVLAAPIVQAGQQSRLLIGLAPFTPPPAHFYQQGVGVILVPQVMRAQPDIKQAEFVLTRRSLPPTGTQTQYEAILLNEADELLEGSSSNLYFIREGAIYTAGVGVLAGTTRRILLSLADTLAIPVHFTAVSRLDIGAQAEAFLSSSSRGIMPVVQIADQLIGNGRPGQITRQLMRAYKAYVQQAVRRAVDEPHP